MIKGNIDAKGIPVKLIGYRRDWSSIQDSETLPNKRYVYPNDMDMPEYYCWANVTKAKEKNCVGGVCHLVDIDRLPEFDQREIGYHRIDVSKQVVPYGVNELLNIPIFVYQDIERKFKGACHPTISKGYFNLTIDSISEIQGIFPEFFDDWVSGTDPLFGTVEDTELLLIDYSFKNLLLVHPYSYTVTLLHQFEKPQWNWKGIESSEMSVANPNLSHYLQRPITEGRKCWDIRIMGSDFEQQEYLPPSHRMFQEASRSHASETRINELALNESWYVRLGASQNANISKVLLERLVEDTDAWVSRAARIRLST